MTAYLLDDLRKAILPVTETPRNLLGCVLDKEYLKKLAGAAHLQGLIREARDDADRAKREPLPALPFSKYRLFASQGTRLEYENPYFERRTRFIGLLLMTLLDEDPSDTIALEDLIWDICGEYTWCLPAHIPMSSERITPEQKVDLFAAETAHALAEAVYLLEDRLDPLVAARVRTEVEYRILQPLFETSYQFSWEASHSNWASVCAGAAGMAAMLLVKDGERLVGMTDRVLRAMESFLSGYKMDGCCPEGVGYWDYGFGFYVYYAEMLRAYTSDAIDLLEGEKIRRIAAFPASMQLSPSSYVNFSDALLNYKPNTGLVCQLHRRLEQPIPYLDEVRSLYKINRWAHASRNVFWSEAGLLQQPMTGGSNLYPNSHWAVMKKQVDLRTFSFACKGGHNDEPHNHNDLGHFILDMDGDTLLTDLGAGLYTKDYFNHNRYTILNNASEGHSVPLVNGCQQAAGRDHQAELAYLCQENDVLELELDLMNAYPTEAQLANLQRSFLWRSEAGSGHAELILTDTFTFEEEQNSLDEILISFHQPEVERGRILWRGTRGSVKLQYDCEMFEAHLEQISIQNHTDEQVTVYRTRLMAAKVGKQAVVRLAFILA